MPTPRTPTRLRALHGLLESPQTARKGSTLDADPPPWLSKAAKAEWRRVMKALARHPEWLQQTDLAVFTAYCATWATFVEAAKDLAKRGPLVPARSSADQTRGDEVLVKNPACQVVRDSTATLRSLCKELGFTPDSRVRVDLGPTTPHKGEDLLDARRLLS